MDGAQCSLAVKPSLRNGSKPCRHCSFASQVTQEADFGESIHRILAFRAQPQCATLGCVRLFPRLSSDHDPELMQALLTLDAEAESKLRSRPLDFVFSSRVDLGQWRIAWAGARPHALANARTRSHGGVHTVGDSGWQGMLGSEVESDVVTWVAEERSGRGHRLITSVGCASVCCCKAPTPTTSRCCGARAAVRSSNALRSRHDAVAGRSCRTGASPA